jgi:hypothetical protein
MKNYYATACIPWYLMIDEDGTSVHLYQLADDAYSLVGSGKVLRIVEPLVATIDPGELLRRR